MAKKPNTVLALIALIYALAETAYFGWNWKWHSPSQAICDGIALVLFALALVSWRERGK